MLRDDELFLFVVVVVMVVAAAAADDDETVDDDITEIDWFLKFVIDTVDDDEGIVDDIEEAAATTLTIIGFIMYGLTVVIMVFRFCPFTVSGGIT